MRRPISSKLNTCAETVDVDAADIKWESRVHYLRRSVVLPVATAFKRMRDRVAEVIVVCEPATERRNMAGCE